jgi:hypothetical protein
VVYCPGVVEFRVSRRYELLTESFWVAVVAAALRQTSESKDILVIVEDGLRVAAAHGHRAVALGA